MDTWMLSKQETVTNLTKGRGKELVIRARCGSLSARDLQIFCCSWDMKVAQKMENFSGSKEFSREKENKKNKQGLLCRRHSITNY